MKRQAKDWKAAKHKSDKRLVSTIKKELLQLNSKKQVNLKMSKRSEQITLLKYKDEKNAQMKIYTASYINRG